MAAVRRTGGWVRPARSSARVALTAVVTVVALMFPLGSTPSEAHTDLVASAPRAGETVGTATERVVLTFGLELTPGSAQVVVLDPRGVDAVTGAPSMSGASLEVPVRLGRPGRHEVTYRALASDGHVVVGELAFEVAARGAGTGAPAGPAPAPPSAPPSAAGSAGGGSPVPLRWGVGVAFLVLLVLLHDHVRPGHVGRSRP